MQKQVKTSKEIRQQKFYLILPLLALPFLTMIFWALGGGKIENVQAKTEIKKGFNINLPDANLKDKPMDKMSYYDQAQLDSVKFGELVKNDPNYQNSNFSDSDGSLIIQKDSIPLSFNKKGLNTSLYGSQAQGDPATDKIYRKLAELDREMSKPAAEGQYADIDQNPSGRSSNKPSISTTDVDRLEQMMNAMNQPSGDDTELKQLNGMLDKILDVQHPELVQEKIKQTSEANRGQVYVVSSQLKENNITVLNATHATEGKRNGFYSFTGSVPIKDTQNTVQAVIHETQTVVDGSTVKLRLLNDVFINGIHIPKDNFLFGIASLNGERLKVEINSIRYNNSIFPVELSVYDMDGLDGIFIPGAITRDVVKQSADRSTQMLGLTSLDPSWQAQAAGAGIEAAKTLFSRKVKLVKVQVKAGYKVLLKNEGEK